jgi:hypothetical protein
VTPLEPLLTHPGHGELPVQQGPSLQPGDVGVLTSGDPSVPALPTLTEHDPFEDEDEDSEDELPYVELDGHLAEWVERVEIGERYVMIAAPDTPDNRTAAHRAVSAAHVIADDVEISRPFGSSSMARPNGEVRVTYTLRRAIEG